MSSVAAAPLQCLYRPDHPPTLRNVLFATTEAAASLASEGLAAMPSPLRSQIDASFAAALRGRRTSLYEAALARRQTDARRR
mmetsp:Transcript_51449/g.109941  ORF Transcript_51449/g.109941 Transcript_51449/m.109941 type:complete len:82 (+) Transcript_51449:26-271(+)